jgi:hypothetical protein
MLEPQEKIMLERALKLAEDNNRIITKMYRAQKWARFFHTLYWVIVIGTAVGAYYFIQPYVDVAVESFGGFGESVERVKTIFNPSEALEGTTNSVE